MSIAGYIYDKNTDRYYKPPVTGPPEFLNRLKEEYISSAVEFNNVCHEVKPHGKRELLKTLSLYETGLRSHSDRNISVLQSKLQRMDPSQYKPVSDRAISNNCQYVASDNGYFYIAGYCAVPDSVVTGYISIDKIKCKYGRMHSNAMPIEEIECTTGFVEPHRYSIADMCGAGNRIIYVSNSNPLRHFLNTVGVITTHDYLPGNDFSHDYNIWSTKDAFRCCTYHNGVKLAALGTEKNILLLPELFRCQKIRSIRSDVFSVEFNKNGLSLYYGCNTGECCVMDLRCQESIKLWKSQSAVTQIKVLSDEYTLILSGYDHQLCKFDMRMGKVTGSFKGHHNFCAKLPISFDEPSNILCAIGEDNTTRLWSLNEGVPLAALTFAKQPLQFQMYSFVFSENRKIYIHGFSGHDMYLYVSS